MGVSSLGEQPFVALQRGVERLHVPAFAKSVSSHLCSPLKVSHIINEAGALEVTGVETQKPWSRPENREISGQAWWVVSDPLGAGPLDASFARTMIRCWALPLAWQDVRGSR